MVNKFIDLVKAKYMIKYKQKIFVGNKYNVKYVLDTKKGSDKLIIIFTSCTKVGVPARYNYVRTLDKYKCNKLFILDDFGFDNRGAYYLGKNKDFAIEKEVNLLINKVITNLNTKKNIFMGSSKGGYAALYFGITVKDSIIISGAPQYKLGDYLNLPGHQNILKYIMGNTNNESIECLNKILQLRINENKNNNNLLYIHYSINEENYESDISKLINDLDKLKILMIKDIEEYMNHSDLTNYFPKFIKEVLDEQLV